MAKYDPALRDDLSHIIDMFVPREHFAGMGSLRAWARYYRQLSNWLWVGVRVQMTPLSLHNFIISVSADVSWVQHEQQQPTINLCRVLWGRRRGRERGFCVFNRHIISWAPTCNTEQLLPVRACFACIFTTSNANLNNHHNLKTKKFSQRPPLFHQHFFCFICTWYAGCSFLFTQLSWW